MTLDKTSIMLGQRMDELKSACLEHIKKTPWDGTISEETKALYLENAVLGCSSYAKATISNCDPITFTKQELIWIYDALSMAVCGDAGMDYCDNECPFKSEHCECFQSKIVELLNYRYPGWQ